MTNTFNPQVISLSWQQTISVRHQVLWPNQAPEFCQVEGDAEALHFGVILNEQVICVASLYLEKEKNIARLRKFATLEPYQGKGVGSLMLNHLIEALKMVEINYLWFDARASALPFYQRFGCTQSGDIFYKNTVAYYKMHIHL